MMNEESAQKTDGGERHNGTNLRRKRPKKVDRNRENYYCKEILLLEYLRQKQEAVE